MGRRIRIPFVIDVMRVSDAETIGGLARDPRLDRAYEKTGPLFNRLLAWRLMRVFCIDNVSFPTMRARGDEERRANQEALAVKLREAAIPTDVLLADIEPLVAYVRGSGSLETTGAALQALIGRHFNPDYAPSAQLWAAAVRFDATARSSNPLRWLLSAITGILNADRRILADAVGRDPIAVHATGIAVHNIVASLERMRACHADPIRRTALDGIGAATACLSAPASILRQAKRVADVPGGSLTPGSLVTFELAAAADRTLDRRVAFQSAAWSACPASDFVFKLLILIWSRARAQEETP
jgi:hypothetical protein